MLVETVFTGRATKLHQSRNQTNRMLRRGPHIKKLSFSESRNSAGYNAVSSSTRRARAGFTLAGTSVAMLVGSVMSIGVAHGVTASKSLNAANEQRLVAFDCANPGLKR